MNAEAPQIIEFVLVPRAPDHDSKRPTWVVGGVTGYAKSQAVCHTESHEKSYVFVSRAVRFHERDIADVSQMVK